jgi:hypothetical protein
MFFANVYSSSTVLLGRDGAYIYEILFGEEARVGSTAG